MKHLTIAQTISMNTEPSFLLKVKTLVNVCPLTLMELHPFPTFQ